MYFYKKKYRGLNTNPNWQPYSPQTTIRFDNPFFVFPLLNYLVTLYRQTVTILAQFMPIFSVPCDGDSAPSLLFYCCLLSLSFSWHICHRRWFAMAFLLICYGFTPPSARLALDWGLYHPVSVVCKEFRVKRGGPREGILADVWSTERLGIVHQSSIPPP